MHQQDIFPCTSEVYPRLQVPYAVLERRSDTVHADFSLHGEMGKIEGKEQGLTSAQGNARYERQRDKDFHISKRKDEYFMGKGVNCRKW